MNTTRHKIGFIGAGRAGSALADGLTRAGYTVAAVYSRSAESAARMAEHCAPRANAAPSAQAVADACDMIFVTTPDDAIGTVAAGVRWGAEHRAVHCSGGLPSSVLAPVRGAGGAAGAFHPLQTFTSPAGERPAAGLLKGVTVAIEAEGGLRAELHAMAEAMGCRPIVVSAEDKALYHVGGVLACNYVAALFDQAAALWEGIGIERGDAERGLMTLLRSTVDNIERLGARGSLTGPIARGDAGVVRHHLDEIGSRAPTLEGAYRELGLLALDMARRNGSIDEAAARAVDAALRTREVQS